MIGSTEAARWEQKGAKGPPTFWSKRGHPLSGNRETWLAPLPVVRCHVEGLTLDEAARRLRLPAGTVHSRLARARDKLRRGLTRRGVVLPAAAMAAVLNPKPASARVSSLLCDTTTKAAIRFAAGQAARGVVSGSAAVLAQEVLRSMLINKLRITVLTLLALTAAATGAGLLTHSLAMMKDESRKSPSGQQQAKLATKLEGASPGPAPGRMFVTGRVLDPQKSSSLASKRLVMIGLPILRLVRLRLRRT